MCSGKSHRDKQEYQPHSSRCGLASGVGPNAVKHFLLSVHGADLTDSQRSRSRKACDLAPSGLVPDGPEFENSTIPKDGSSFQTFRPPARGLDGAERDRGSVAVVSRPWLNRREAVLGPMAFESR
jgi:hypothetical protein